MSPGSRSRLTIDLNALAHNYGVLVGAAGTAEVAPVVKADAYGLGAAQVSRKLWAEGARRFFVARLEEGETLRAALGPNRPCKIYVLDGYAWGDRRRWDEAGLTPVLSTPNQATLWAKAGGGPAALHIDTGMHRLGLTPEQAAALAADPDRPRIDLVISHLACAGDSTAVMNARQRAAFRACAKAFPGARLSLAGTAGMFLGEAFLLDLVRPGIGLYGGGPFDRPDPRLRPVAKLEAPILAVGDVQAGQSIGYAATQVAAQDMRIATISAGYADGLPWGALPHGFAWAGGQLRPLVGRVSMDLAMIDVSHGPTPVVGDDVELLGPHRLLDDVARETGLMAHALLTGLGTRAERIYIGEHTLP